MHAFRWVANTLVHNQRGRNGDPVEFGKYFVSCQMYNVSIRLCLICYESVKVTFYPRNSIVIFDIITDSTRLVVCLDILYQLGLSGLAPPSASKGGSLAGLVK